MENARREPFRILVLDEDLQACARLLDPEAALPFHVHWTPQIQSIRDENRALDYDVLLISETLFQQESVRSWIQRAEIPPDCVWVGSREPADENGPSRETPGRVRRPYDPEEICRCLMMRLRDPLFEDRLEKELESLRNAEKELLERRRTLESVRQRLQEGRRALAILEERLRAEAEEAVRSVCNRVRSEIMPLVKGLQQDPDAASAGQELEELLEITLSGMKDPNSLEGRMISDLTTTELRVAALVRRGCSSKEIARRLRISTTTVSSHRKMIRRKLGICGRHYSLRYLLAAAVRRRTVRKGRR